MNNAYLFYSNNCPLSKQVLTLIQQTQLSLQIVYFDVDIPNTKIPNGVTQTPTLVIKNYHTLLIGNTIVEYIISKQPQQEPMTQQQEHMTQQQEPISNPLETIRQSRQTLPPISSQNSSIQHNNNNIKDSMPPPSQEPLGMDMGDDNFSSLDGSNNLDSNMFSMIQDKNDTTQPLPPQLTSESTNVKTDDLSNRFEQLQRERETLMPPIQRS